MRSGAGAEPEPRHPYSAHFAKSGSQRESESPGTFSSEPLGRSNGQVASADSTGTGNETTQPTVSEPDTEITKLSHLVLRQSAAPVLGADSQLTALVLAAGY